jgi:hypothetical protein
MLSFSIHAAALHCNVSLFYHRTSGAQCLLCVRFAISVAVASITMHDTQVLLAGCMRWMWLIAMPPTKFFSMLD